MPPDPQYPMLPHYQLGFHTKLQNFKKKGIDDICGISYKTRKLQKKRKLFVNPYIHMLPEKGIDDICGTSYKTRKLQKK